MKKILFEQNIKFLWWGHLPLRTTEVDTTPGLTKVVRQLSVVLVLLDNCYKYMYFLNIYINLVHFCKYYTLHIIILIHMYIRYIYTLSVSILYCFICQYYIYVIRCNKVLLLLLVMHCPRYMTIVVLWRYFSTMLLSSNCTYQIIFPIFS